VRHSLIAALLLIGCTAKDDGDGDGTEAPAGIDGLYKVVTYTTNTSVAACETGEAGEESSFGTAFFELAADAAVEGENLALYKCAFDDTCQETYLPAYLFTVFPDDVSATGSYIDAGKMTGAGCYALFLDSTATLSGDTITIQTIITVPNGLIAGANDDACRESAAAYTGAKQCDSTTTLVGTRTTVGAE
jgi:hypothetical protein